MNFLIPIYQLSTHNRPKLLLIIYNRLHLELNQFKPPICRHLLSFTPNPTPPHIPLTFNVRQSESRRLSMGFLLPLTFTQGELNWILNICTSIISQAASFFFWGVGKKHAAQPEKMKINPSVEKSVGLKLHCSCRSFAAFTCGYPFFSSHPHCRFNVKNLTNSTRSEKKNKKRNKNTAAERIFPGIFADEFVAGS